MAENNGGSNAARGCLLVVFLSAVCGIVGLAGTMVGGGSLLSQSGGTDPQPQASDPDVAVAPSPAKSKKRGGKATGALVEHIASRGVLKVGIDTGEPPFTGTPPMYQPNRSGEPDGFDVVLARRIAAAVGARDIKVVHGKYSELEDLVKQPEQVDLVISGYAATETPGLAFSQPYFEYGLCLVVPTKSKIQTTKDLFGKKIGIFDDDAAAEEVGGLVKGFTSMTRLEDGYWDQLSEGKFDAFFYDYPYTVAELNNWYKANPSRAGSLRIAQYNLTDSAYVVMLREGDADLLAVVDETIKEWRASPDYSDAVKAWLKGGLAIEAPKGAKTHTVAKGETLSLIAKAELGSVDDWTTLWELNKVRFPNPHLIDVGDSVVLP